MYSENFFPADIVMPLYLALSKHINVSDRRVSIFDLTALVQPSFHVYFHIKHKKLENFA